jgi:hypothetical protein
MQSLQELVDSEEGFLRLVDSSEKVDVYQTAIGWPFLATLIDGFGVPASWTQEFGYSRSQTFFKRLREISPTWKAFYIKHQDDAWLELDWERELNSIQIASSLLNEFTVNPALEGGSSFLGLYLDYFSDCILLTLSPAQYFRISVYGSLRSIVIDALKTEQGAAANP